MAVLVGAASDPGQVRPDNEDRYAVLLPPQVVEGLDAVLVVADGMGGHQAGETASATAVERFVAWFGQGGQLGTVAPEADLGAALERVIEEANREVRRKALSDASLRGMGTTVTAAAVVGGSLYLGHVGDSRAYLLREGATRQLTRDHSWVAEEVRAGRMTQSEAESHPYRNALTRAVGGTPDVQVDTDVYDLAVGDHLILCTDGLFNTVSAEEIAQTVRTYGQPNVAAGRLVTLANERGAPDNVTVLIARLREPSLPLVDGNSDTRVMALPRGARSSRSGRKPGAGLLVPAGIILLLVAVVVGLAIGLGVAPTDLVQGVFGR